LLSYNKLKNRVVIAGGKPFFSSPDIELSDPNIHPIKIVVTLLPGEAEIGPSNQVHSKPPILPDVTMAWRWL
jgi:hypothetical protein